MKRFIFYSLFVFLAFYFLNDVFKKPSLPPECPVVTCEIDSAKRKFEEIAHSDYEDYIRLKAEEKYKKADEILQKIFAIFIADLGLHLKEKPHVSESPSPSSTPKAKLAIKEALPPVKALPTPKPYQQVSPADLRSLSPSSEAAFLKRELLDDPKQALFSAEPIQTLDRSLSGCFVGTRTLADKPSQQVLLWLGDIAGGPIVRNFKIIFLINGKAGFHSSGSTENQILTLDKNDPDEFIFYFVPGTYFQVYFASNREKLIGNEYDQKGSSGYRWNGGINLQKTNDCRWLSEFNGSF